MEQTLMVMTWLATLDPLVMLYHSSAVPRTVGWLVSNTLCQSLWQRTTGGTSTESSGGC